MEESVVEVQGEEAKLMVAQFLGQSMGFLKEIDRNITNRTSTLQGMTIDPVDIINRLPGGQPVSRQPLPPQQQFIAPPVEQPQQQATWTSPAVTVGATTSPPENKDQFEFNFNYDAVKGVDDKLASLEKQVKKLSSDISKILELLESKQDKKKVDKHTVF